MYKKKSVRLSPERVRDLQKLLDSADFDEERIAGECLEQLKRQLRKGRVFMQHQGYGRYGEVWYAPATAEEIFSLPDDDTFLRRIYLREGFSYYDYVKHCCTEAVTEEVRKAGAFPARCHVTRRQGGNLSLPQYIDRYYRGLHSPLRTITDIVCAELSLSDFCRLLEDRKGYEELANLRRLKEEFVKGIPEDFTLLFPKARSMRRHFIIHVGGTNTGKTHDALEALMQAPSGIYLGPLRLLAMENQEKMNDCGVLCSLMTGEEEQIIEGARHVSATVEKADLNNFYDAACIDECQMIGDRERGWAWTDAILGLAAGEIHICTAPSALDLIKELLIQCEDTWEVIEHERSTPLIPEKCSFALRREDIRRYDALIAFSRKKVLDIAAELERMNIKASVIYGALPYRVRKAEVKRYLEGETKVVVATDAIGMGMNLPIHRIVFLEDQKFDGKTKRSLNSQEVKQIAGRAGRLGMFAEGYVNSAVNMPQIAHLLEMEDEKVQTAGIQLPEKMLYMPGSLLSILTEWDKMSDKGVYRRSDVKHEMAVCRAIEANFSLEKEQIYHFLHIPFDEEDPELMDLFLVLMQNYVSGSSEVYGTQSLTLRELSKLNLQKLERLYKQLDLCSSFYICTNHRENLAQIQWNREKICDVITARLKKKENAASRFVR